MKEDITVQIGKVKEFSWLERELNSTEMNNRSFWTKASDLYFMPKSFEKNGELYERLGVRHFKRLLTKPIRKLNRWVLILIGLSVGVII